MPAGPGWAWHETCTPRCVTDAPISPPLRPADHASNGVCQPPNPPTPAKAPVQRIIKVRRDYNLVAASETMEDYALRLPPARFRRWSVWRVANMAFGASSFLPWKRWGHAAAAVRLHQCVLGHCGYRPGSLRWRGCPSACNAARYGWTWICSPRGAGFITSAPPSPR